MNRTVRLGIRVVGGVALLAAALWFAGPRALAAALGRVDPLVFVAALMVSIASNAVSALRWAAIAGALDIRAPARTFMAMYARAMTSNTLLPGATLSGDMLRAYELSRLGHPLLESSVSVAFDRFSGLWTLCVMSFLAAGIAVAAGLSLTAGDHGREILVAYGSLLAGIVVAPLIPWPVDWLRNARVGAIRRLADWWARYRDPQTGIRKRLATSLWLSVLVQILSAGALVLCGKALGSPAPALLTFAAAAPIFVMGAVPLGVAGFGTRELAAVGVLGLAGVSPDVAAATGLLYGILGVLQGILAAPLFVLRRGGGSDRSGLP